MSHELESYSYLGIFVFPLLTLLGYFSTYPGYAVLTIFGFLLVSILVLEPLLGKETHHPISRIHQQRNEPLEPGAGDFRVGILYAYVVVEGGLILAGLYSVTYRDYRAAWLIYALPVGFSGSFSLLVAHELMHTRSRSDVFFSRLAGAMQFWGVHELEHLYIHHRNDISCTDQDTSHAKLGQSAYSYIAKSVYHNFHNAWRIEREMLCRNNRSEFAIQNRVLQTIGLSIALTALIGVGLGLYAVLFFLSQATFSMFQFLLATYNQHYGLTRRKNSAGAYEEFTYMNVWSSDYRLTSRLTANLSRHAHHHLYPFCPYYDLKIIENSPILPGGYNTVSLLALCPPLWYKVMNKRVRKVLETRERLQTDGRLEQRISG